ncbi:uncharacterized protein LOC126846665 isoform X1 [Adelges cooleyi]|uniref:uncharacterized protein LOC126846665 isoform X1 n=1 Tax=Adelges cooleyi TaxID=133065 RepID=UPI0021806F98|nr:uncharacterized protein LOC126846665 isoform X1 [Adelges cooleyi]
MYLKTTILFFCMTLYFLLCQGVKPVPEDRERDPDPVDRLVIYRVITSNLEPGGYVAFKNLRKIVNDCAKELGSRIRLPGQGVSTLDFISSADYLEGLALWYVGASDIEKSVNKNYNTISQIKDSLSYLYRIFDKTDVRYYALAFLASVDPKISKMVHNLVLINTNPNGNKYPEYENLMKAVMLETEIKIKYLTPDEYRQDTLSQYRGGKLTVDQVEELVIHDLYHQTTFIN